MKNFIIKLSSTIFLSLFIIASSNAQKIETDKVSRSNSDFTTTPFQDGNQAKGLDVELADFQMVQNGKFEEGDVKLKIPIIFNPTKEAFSIDEQAVILKMKIYNMLGELVYEGKMNAAWQDEHTKDGLYMYAIDARVLPNKTTKLKGFIRVKK